MGRGTSVPPLTDLYLPAGGIEKMLPTEIGSPPEGDIIKRRPSRFLWHSDQAHPGIFQCLLSLFEVTQNTTACDIRPGCRTPQTLREDMVQIELALFKSPATILTRVFIPYVHVLARKLHLFEWQIIIVGEKDYLRNPNTQGNSPDEVPIITVLTIDGRPSAEVVGGEGSIIPGHDMRSIPVKEG